MKHIRETEGVRLNEGDIIAGADDGDGDGAKS